MGLFDRLRDAVGRESPVPTDPGVDRGEGSSRLGGDTTRKTGSHGSHWDTLTPDNATAREAVLTAVEEGETRDGVAVEAGPVIAHVHPSSGPIRTVAISIDDRIVTAFPGGDGITHDVIVTDVTEWANGVEAQLSIDCVGRQLGAFDTGYFFREPDWYGTGESYRMDIAGFAYELAHIQTNSDERRASGNSVDDWIAAIMQFDGGDVDDYVFRTRISGVEEHEFAGRTVYRIRAPLFRTDEDDVEFAIYASDHITGGYRPEPGDDVDGVCWLQGRVV